MNLSRYLKISPFFQAWTTRPPWSSRGAENAKHLKAHWVGWIWKKISRNSPVQKENWRKIHGFVDIWSIFAIWHSWFFYVFLLLYFLFKICWFLNSWTLQNSWIPASTAGWGLSGINPTLHILIHIAQHLMCKNQLECNKQFTTLSICKSRCKLKLLNGTTHVGR